jgi:hypothetical protein
MSLSKSYTFPIIVGDLYLVKDIGWSTFHEDGIMSKNDVVLITEIRRVDPSSILWVKAYNVTRMKQVTASGEFFQGFTEPYSIEED